MEEVVYEYTRQQALEDGDQVDVSKNAAEAGILYPVFLTRRVHDAHVVVPPNVEAQDEAGRLWDILWMLRCEIRRDRQRGSRIAFSLHVRNDNYKPGLVDLIAYCGPLDINNSQPAITIMMPDED